MDKNIIYNMNCLEGFKLLPSNSIDCIVTSPPYYGLRDYNHKDQIGLEDSPDLFINKMVSVFSECKRVLKDEGTLWINMGDSYASAPKNRTEEQAIKKSTLNGSLKNQQQILRQINKVSAGIKPKDLLGIPWLLAFALRADGWYLRQDIIWHKPNPMPESVTDRCTKSHEYLFLLSKSSRYFYDAFSIRVPYAEKTFSAFGTNPKGNGDGSGLIASENWAKSVTIRKPKEWKMPDGWDTGKGAHGSFHRNGREKGKSGNKERKPRPGAPENNGKHQMGSVPWEGSGANKRSVWTVSTQSFPEAHFATFPEELIVDCIKAGCPEDGIVLDPFMGAATTALVAAKLNRNFIGFEINKDYCTIAKKRLAKELGMFNPLKIVHG